MWRPSDQPFQTHSLVTSLFPGRSNTRTVVCLSLWPLSSLPLEVRWW
ncbi:hypothetical protein E2C01_097882 [Portunus trituberculatus]|uniref:Uncharacterized protein n=1 Tax=Portunus trituberculatus TaxID=210409 RepID=A0A5B7K612_PORTR|nr:hypothetical protein [Portunus trituberculatus]